jgi:hypothetical protein
MGAFVTKRGKIDAAGWKEVLNDFFSQGTLKHEIAVGLEASLFWEEVAISIRVFRGRADELLMEKILCRPSHLFF